MLLYLIKLQDSPALGNAFEWVLMYMLLVQLAAAAEESPIKIINI